jgi:hypothetical protein
VFLIGEKASGGGDGLVDLALEEGRKLAKSRDRLFC